MSNGSVGYIMLIAVEVMLEPFLFVIKYHEIYSRATFYLENIWYGGG